MYRPDPHPDPYANQYPPPPPLAPEPHAGYVAPPPPGPMPTPSAYMPPQQQQAIYPPEGTHSNSGVMDHQDVATAGQYGGGYSPPSFHSVPMATAPHYAQHTMDPQAVTMEEFRQTEQHEQLYNSSYGQQQHHDSYYRDYRDEPDMSTPHSPMVQPPPLLQQPSSQKTIRPEDPDSYQPAQQKQHRHHSNNKYTTGPMVAPVDEAEAYRPKYYDRDDRRGCNCCCYNPAMTCCSCFCFLISLAFLAGGIALIIAAKVIGDKCNAQCGDVVDKAASIGVSAQPCDAICGKVVHDGMFYGGIAIAGLAAIAAIWKVFMWMCAAGSRR